MVLMLVVGMMITCAAESMASWILARSAASSFSRAASSWTHQNHNARKEGMREEGGVRAAEAPLMHARGDAAIEWWLRLGIGGGCSDS
jgi:hypothetical protein